MRFVLILLGLLMFADVAQAVDCEKLPDCASLGYSQQEDKDCDKDGYMTCPFDDSYKKCVHYSCESLGFTQADKSSWCNEIAFCPSNSLYTLCKRRAVQCKVGDVYYADDTCGSSDNLDGSKTPVGVVFYVTADGRHGRVLAFDDISTPYTEKASITIQLPLFTCQQLVENLEKGNPDLYDGQEQTQKVAAFDPKSAAAIALEYSPQGIDPSTPYTGKGNWYLPAFGEWKWLYAYKLTGGCSPLPLEGHYQQIPVLSVLKKLKKETLNPGRYWSINLASSTNAHYFGLSYGDGGPVEFSNKYAIRPIMKF